MDSFAIAQMLVSWLPEKWRPVALLILASCAACSLVMSKVNARMRARAEAGATFGRWSLRILAFFNTWGLNPDKSIQFLKGYRGPSVAPGTTLAKAPVVPFGGGSSLLILIAVGLLMTSSCATGHGSMAEALCLGPVCESPDLCHEESTLALQVKMAYPELAKIEREYRLGFVTAREAALLEDMVLNGKQNRAAECR